MVKNLPVMQETHVRPLNREDALEKGMATHSSILAWKIPWTESLAGYSPWGHRESNTTEHAVCGGGWGGVTGREETLLA